MLTPDCNSRGKIYLHSQSIVGCNDIMVHSHGWMFHARAPTFSQESQDGCQGETENSERRCTSCFGGAMKIFRG